VATKPDIHVDTAAVDQNYAQLYKQAFPPARAADQAVQNCQDIYMLNYSAVTQVLAPPLVPNIPTTATAGTTRNWQGYTIHKLVLHAKHAVNDLDQFLRHDNDLTFKNSVSQIGTHKSNDEDPEPNLLHE
jgi:hypothetical protein